jgi:hypothetical protein
MPTDGPSERFVRRSDRSDRSESSEYDPLFSGGGFGDLAAPPDDDLEPVRERFAAASRPFLHSPLSWLSWAILLPMAAFASKHILWRAGPAGVLLLWSATILLGGAVEIGAIFWGGRAGRAGNNGRRAARTPLAAWVLRLQGNLSFVALVLSALCLWLDAAWALPGIWLLLLGHSFYMLGGLAFSPFRTCGLIFQFGGLVALWPKFSPLMIFAITTAAGNLWMAWGIWRGRSASPRRGSTHP